MPEGPIDKPDACDDSVRTSPRRLWAESLSWFSRQAERFHVAFRGRRATWALLLVGMGFVLWWSWAWTAPGLPAGDMGGTVAGLERWRQLITRGELTDPWNDAWFCGASRSLFNVDGHPVAYIPFLVCGDALTAVKTGAMVYIALSVASAFLLMHHLLRHRAIALVMGVAYALHPIHLSVTAGTSHANFPPFYALMPLVILAVLRLSSRPSCARVAATALLASLTFWLDPERFAILAPWLAAVAAGMFVVQRCRRRLRRTDREVAGSILAVCCMGLLTAGLLAALVLPVIVEKPATALFSKETRDSSREFFSIQNPLYYVDRNGDSLEPVYRRLPPRYSHDAGTFYLGNVLLILAGTGLVLWPKPLRLRAILAVAAIGGASALATAQGAYGGLDSLCKVFDRVFLYAPIRRETAAVLVRFLGAVACVLLSLWGLWLMRWRRTRAICLGWPVIGAAATAILLSARPFEWVFRHVPPFAEMRNPGWFATAVPGLAVTLAAGVGLRCVLAGFRRRWCRRLLFCLVVVALLWDVAPYRACFDNQLDAEAVDELRTISEILAGEGKQGRVLSRETYNPHTDLLYSFSGRPAAFYWLNWMSPADTSSFVRDGIYTRLHRPETIAKALDLAGWASVRYIVYDLTEGPLPPHTDALEPLWGGRCFALYENKRCRPYVTLLPAGAATRPDSGFREDMDAGKVTRVRRTGGTQIDINVELNRPAVVMLSESWFPGWEVRLDGAEVDCTRVQHAFMGVAVGPGIHTIRFHRPRQWYWTTGGYLTLASVAICVACLTVPALCSLGRRLRERVGRV